MVDLEKIANDSNQKETIKFSIILPIYNVEKYLDRCIESIYLQDYKDFELILVDDGSPDNCPQKCDIWAGKDTRVKVIHKKNEGLGMARNSGLSIATGKYVMFLDSDDYISKGLFKEAARYLEANEVDLLTYGHMRINSYGKRVAIYSICTDRTLYCGNDVYDVFWPEFISTNPKTGFASGLLMSAWCSFYKLETLKKSSFSFVSERELICEDVYSLMKLMPAVKSVGVLREPYYCYCDNEVSLTRTYRNDRFEKIVYFQKQLEQLCSSEVYTDEIRVRIYRPYLDNVLACLKMEVEQTKKVTKYKILKRIENICENEMTKKAVSLIPYNSYSMSRKLLHYLLKNEKTRLIYFLLKIKLMLR